MHALLLTIGLLFVAAATARQPYLYTSTISYCTPPSKIIVEEFIASFYKHNHSVVFTIVAQATESLNLSGNAIVNAYSLKPIDLNFNLCEVASFLCPVPQYTFNGSASVPVSTNVAHRIPGIAYILPDLEAYVQLNLVDDATRENVVCIQSTVSNGLSTRIASISWATGGIAIAAVLVAIIFSAVTWSKDDTAYVGDDRAPNPAAWQFVNYMSFLQHIVVTGVLNLNYPIAYSSYTLNFAWSFGLFGFDATSSFQSSIDNLRSLTGATDISQARDPTLWGDRELSPYNFISRRRSAQYERRDIVQYVQNNSTIAPGLPKYVNSLDIATANACMSVFLTALILIAIFLSGFLIGYLLMRLMATKRTDSPLPYFRQHYGEFATTIITRVVLAIILPITTLSFFQWTLHDAWLPDLLSALLTALLWCTLAGSCVSLVLAHRSSSLFESPSFVRLAAFVEPYLSSRWQFVMAVTMPSLMAKAAFVGFAQSSGWIQVIGILTVEVLVLISTILLRPRLTRGGDAFEILFAVIRVVGVGSLIAFEDSLRIKPIPRLVVAFAAIVLNSVGVILVVLALAINAVLRPFISLMRRRRRTRNGGQPGNEADWDDAERVPKEIPRAIRSGRQQDAH